MLNPILLATSMLFAVPALAQDVPAQDVPPGQQQVPPQDQSAPPPADTRTPGQQDPATAAQANPPPATEAAQPTPSQPAASQTQVAEAVSRDFGTYDKDASGALSQDEFGAWMGALRKAAEPSFQPGSAEANVWVGQAFAAADTDRSASVSQTELTAFLTPKQPS